MTSTSLYQAFPSALLSNAGFPSSVSNGNVLSSKRPTHVCEHRSSKDIQKTSIQNSAQPKAINSQFETLYLVLPWQSCCQECLLLPAPFAIYYRRSWSSACARSLRPTHEGHQSCTHKCEALNLIWKLAEKGKNSTLLNWELSNHPTNQGLFGLVWQMGLVK